MLAVGWRLAWKHGDVTHPVWVTYHDTWETEKVSWIERSERPDSRLGIHGVYVNSSIWRWHHGELYYAMYVSILRLFDSINIVKGFQI